MLMFRWRQWRNYDVIDRTMMSLTLLWYDVIVDKMTHPDGWDPSIEVTGGQIKVNFASDIQQHIARNASAKREYMQNIRFAMLWFLRRWLDKGRITSWLMTSRSKKWALIKKSTASNNNSAFLPIHNGGIQLTKLLSPTTNCKAIYWQ